MVKKNTSIIISVILFSGMNSALYRAPKTAVGEKLCGWARAPPELSCWGRAKNCFGNDIDNTRQSTLSSCSRFSTWMILESSSKEFLQSPQYSCANCRMYRFTLAEVELMPPAVPESSCNQEGSCQPSTMRWPHPGASLLLLTQNPLQMSLQLWTTCGFSGAASFTLQSRFSSCGRCPISW